MVVDVVRLEALLEYLNQHYEVPIPTSDLALREIQALFWIDPKYPDLVLLNKVDKILLQDFDHIYINLLTQTR